MIFLNRGGSFLACPLPAEAPFAPAFGLVAADFDGDAHEDLFLAQNFFPVDAETSRYDAGRGLLLRGDGRGSFTPVPGQESGIMIYGDQRAAAACDWDKDGRIDLAVTQNLGPTVLLKNRRSAPGLRVTLNAGPHNPTGIGAVIRLRFPGGEGPAHEVRAGDGYLSQSSPVLVLNATGATEAMVRWPGGKTTRAAIAPDARTLRIEPP